MATTERFPSGLELQQTKTALAKLAVAVDSLSEVQTNREGKKAGES